MSCLAAGTLLVLAGAAAGCGNQYRPVINPIQPTGPASQPTAYAVVFSQPQQLTSGASVPTDPHAVPCPTGPNGASYANPGIVSVVDFSGDNIMAQANVGFGPLTFALDGGGSTAYSTNCDGTLSTVPVSTQLQSKDVGSTTLLQNPASTPTNILIGTSFDYVAQQGRDSVGALTGSPLALKQEIPVAPSLVNVAGTYSGPRVYAISQGYTPGYGSGSEPLWGDCDSPSSVTTNGEADAIEVATNTISNHIPLGVCPVYGLATQDDKRTFILNRGSGTITVIDSQKNLLDTQTLSNYLKNATIPVGAGPVYADLYTPGALLVTANYDSGTVSIIDVSLDIYGNDSPNFGHVLATVPLCPAAQSSPCMAHPVEVSILQDGSRAYVADQNDPTNPANSNGAVSVVNLSSFTVENTIPVNGHPRAIASSYSAPIGKVYVVSPDSSLMTVIRTDTDTISGTVQLQGNGVDVRTTAQYAGTSGTSANNNTESRSSGSGAP